MLRIQRSKLAIWSALAALSLLFAGVDAAKAGAAHAVTTSPVSGASGATVTPSCKLIVNFQRHNFSESVKINNKWLPLVFAGAPDTWIAGTARWKARIIMLAKPRVGTPSYLQGPAPTIGFVDCAKVIKTGQKVCTPCKCYRNALVTDE
jgi:hypothetical protein